VITQTTHIKKSSPVSFKNAFRSILLCQFSKGENEEEIEALLEDTAKAKDSFQQSSNSTILTKSFDLGEDYEDSHKSKKVGTLWGPYSPINKLVGLL
jgi:hypothetical protein